MSPRFPFVALALGCLVGCGGGSPPMGGGPIFREARDAGKKDAPEQAADAPPRKIIFTGRVELLVGAFDKAEQDLLELVKDKDGYVAKAEVQGEPGRPRSGTWTVRVPAHRFDAFMNESSRLGELQRKTTDSEDITDKYYDLKAHIKTDQVEEEGLQKLYLEKSASSKLDELVALRRELKTIRGEIEQQQGRLQRWDKETEYATVVVALTARKVYEPETAPDFGTNVGRTFAGSIDLLGTVGKGLVLLVVALAPWLVVLGVVSTPVWLTLRLRARQRATPSVELVEVAPRAGGPGATARPPDHPTG
jgi:Domain of unknown function (DUF4349)